MECHISNGQFCHINSPLYAADMSNYCSYALYLQKKIKEINFCILSVINQTQDEAININDSFWAISTLQNNKKLYITCLQYSYSITLCFLYHIIYLSNGCKVNTIMFVLPSINKCNIHSIMEAPEKMRF